MIPLAFTLSEAPLMIVKGLAVLAGAFAGAFLIGLTVRLLVRLARPRPMPGWALGLVRLGGAAIGGVVVWLLVADMTGLGWGGGGGLGGGLGGGPSKTEDSKKDVKVKPDDKVQPPKDGDTVKKEEKPLHVFVLGLKDLKDRLKTESPNIDNCYWIQGDPQPQVRDLDGLKKELRLRRETKKTLKVYMDTTRNSPDRFNPDFWVPLEVWLGQEKLYSQEP